MYLVFRSVIGASFPDFYQISKSRIPICTWCSLYLKGLVRHSVSIHLSYNYKLKISRNFYLKTFIIFLLFEIKTGISTIHKCTIVSRKFYSEISTSRTQIMGDCYVTILWHTHLDNPRMTKFVSKLVGHNYF